MDINTEFKFQQLQVSIKQMELINDVMEMVWDNEKAMQLLNDALYCSALSMTMARTQ